MQLMRLADVPVDSRQRVFRYSRLRAVLGATILMALALGAFIFAWLKHASLAYYVAAKQFAEGLVRKQPIPG